MILKPVSGIDLPVFDLPTDLTTVKGRVLGLVTVNCRLKSGFCGEGWSGAGLRWNFSGLEDNLDRRSPGVRLALRKVFIGNTGGVSVMQLGTLFCI